MPRTGIALLVAVFALASLTSSQTSSEPCSYNCVPEDCVNSQTCESCTRVKDPFYKNLCVWCRTNATCVKFDDVCPLEEAKVDEVVMDGSKCIVYSDSQQFYMVLGGVILALVALCGIGCYYSRKRAAEEEDIELQRLAFQKQKASKSEKDIAATQKKKKNDLQSENKSHAKANQRKEEEDQGIVFYEVISKGGLRYRDEPNSNGEVLGVKPFGSVLEVAEKRGNWLKHSVGWSMMSDGKNRLFVKKSEGEEISRGALWTCSECTFLNSATAKVCEQCNSPKHVKQVSPDDVIVLKKGSAHNLR